jgi:dihydroorotate dehydrogenase electron transfer subunit
MQLTKRHETVVGKQQKGWNELKAEIIDTDKCCLCGACANFCDNIHMTPAGPVEQGPLCSELATCRGGYGTCYNVCPYTGTDELPIDLLDRWVSDAPSRDVTNPFNHDITIVAARYSGPSTGEKLIGGGAEAGLLIAAMRIGIINGVISTHVKDDTPTILTSEEEILARAHCTPFANAPMACISEALQDGLDAIAVVGSGCEVQALRKMQNNPALDLEVHDLVSLAIGSFCFFKPKPSRLEEYFAGLGIQRSAVDWIDHAGRPFTYAVKAGDSLTDIPLNDLYQHTAKGSCASCADNTANLADISVGVVDALPGWSILAIRTSRGRKVFDAAKQLGLIETDELNGVLADIILEVTRNRLTFAAIEAVSDDATDTKTFTFTAPSIARAYKPGQFVVCWLPDVDFFPMGIAHVEGDRIEITVQRVGEGTAALFGRQVGDKISLRGPYGSGWDLSNDNYLVVGGGVGIAGVTSALDALVTQGKTAVAVLAGRTADQLLCQDLYGEKISEVCLMTDDGSVGFAGLATDPIERLVGERGLERIITCGPEPMMRRVLDISQELGIPVQASLERMMKCCVGLCGTCCVDGEITVCKSGPVFDGQTLARIESFGSYARFK